MSLIDMCELRRIIPFIQLQTQSILVNTTDADWVDIISSVSSADIILNSFNAPFVQRTL